MDILIAEDEHSSQRILKTTVKKWGFIPVTTGNGKEAWDILKSAGAPDIALLGWDIPGISGIEVCRNIKAMKKDMPTYVIMLTARDSKNDIVMGLEAGADDYMTKPYYSTELLARINVAIRLINIQMVLARKIQEREEALDKLKKLKGLISICSYCKSIRKKDNNWERIEVFIESKSDLRFSHGICPDCAREYFPNFFNV